MKPDSPKNTNWISQLDDNIYLKQLSIPGAYCKDVGGDNEDAAPIQKMLDMGVRAFDVREIDFLHTWTTHYDVSDAVCKTFKEFLQQNSQEFIIVYSDKNVGECFKEDGFSVYNLTTENVGTTTVHNMRGKIVTAYRSTNYFFEDGKSDWDVNNRLFPHEDCTSSNFQLAPEGWNSWDTDGAVSNWGEQNLKNSDDKTAIYNQIIQYEEQHGYTGIVSLHDIDYTDNMTNITDEQLIQAIIKCNFRFILERKTN